MDASRIASAIERFVRWLNAYGETSSDHQSYYAGPVGGRAKRLYYRHPRLGLLAVAPMVASEALFPAARRLFWKRQRFPIADAHYAMGFAALAERSCASPGCHARAVHFLQVLESTRCPGYEQHAWGYPFDWVTRTGTMPAQTPLITTIPYVYESLAAVHALDGNQRWLEVMHSAAEFCHTAIKDRVLDQNEATCGYNPADEAGGVVNASAYRAFVLFAAAHRFGRSDYADKARRNLNYVLRAQRPDGSWPYATDGVRDFVDHFHTCFVLKALTKIEALERDPGCTAAIHRGVAYYVRHLFDGNGLPRPFAHAPRLTVYKRELYDYAECINLGLLLRGRYAALDARLNTTLDDLLARWQKRDGSFRARELAVGWDNVPMHRWAQSQAFRSLCLALASAEDKTAAASRSGQETVPEPASAAALMARVEA